MIQENRKHFSHYYFMVEQVIHSMDKDEYFDLQKVSQAARNFYCYAKAARQVMRAIPITIERELIEEVM